MTEAAFHIGITCTGFQVRMTEAAFHVGITCTGFQVRMTETAFNDTGFEVRMTEAAFNDTGFEVRMTETAINIGFPSTSERLTARRSECRAVALLSKTVEDFVTDNYWNTDNCWKIEIEYFKV